MLNPLLFGCLGSIEYKGNSCNDDQVVVSQFCLCYKYVWYAEKNTAAVGADEIWRRLTIQQYNTIADAPYVTSESEARDGDD